MQDLLSQHWYQEKNQKFHELVCQSNARVLAKKLLEQWLSHPRHQATKLTWYR
jgi:hypothetical protein